MMRLGVSLARAVALISLLCGAEAADLPSQAPSPASPPSCFASFVDYFLSSAQECPLAWNAITLYGILDYGAGYQTHGVPFNGVYPNGVEELISKNSNGPVWRRIPTKSAIFFRAFASSAVGPFRQTPRWI